MATDTAMKNIATILAKKWIGFDLDDTLHEFRKASRAATTHCLTLIADRHSHIPLQELQERYQQVLKEGTAGAFVDGKTSHDYRRARFVATLDHFSLHDDRVDNGLLDEYERVLVANLELKQGAKSLLGALKDAGSKVVVITEGPQDAQERAVRDLGIAQYIDLLVTTNQFGLAKTSGLFKKVLEHLAIGPEDIAYVGDSWERDILPSMAEGIDAIWLNEKNAPLNKDVLSVSSLNEVVEAFH